MPQAARMCLIIWSGALSVMLPTNTVTVGPVITCGIRVGRCRFCDRCWLWGRYGLRGPCIAVIGGPAIICNARISFLHFISIPVQNQIFRLNKTTLAYFYLLFRVASFNLKFKANKNIYYILYFGNP